MIDTEIGMVMKYVAGNWPAAPITDETMEVYALELRPFAFDETLEVLRRECASDAFPPSPMRLRELVVAASLPTTSWEELLGELLDQIMAVGYASPEPAWSHPALAAFVAQRGGWVTVCQSTPARDSLGNGGVSTFNTWQAQARDALRPLIVSAVRDRRPALSAPSDVDVMVAGAIRGVDDA